MTNDTDTKATAVVCCPVAMSALNRLPDVDADNRSATASGPEC
jgi:hypothetical protein